MGTICQGVNGNAWRWARIMYRDADIWILDEPTSSMDPEAEAAIFAELKENLKGRIGIVISHRFSTVRMARPDRSSCGWPDYRVGNAR
ncbi:MAG: hypothetical protein WDN75_01030 [Bacteroidota bacterium]